MQNPVLHFVVPDALDGARLDVALARLVPEVSRRRLAHLVKAGEVRVDAALVRRPSESVASGARLELSLPDEPPPLDSTGERVEELVVVYEDDAIVVIDKPAGLLTHRSHAGQAPGVAELAERRWGPLPQNDGAARPGVVHRLDRGTSGLILVARTPAALATLQGQFADRTVEKSYVALTYKNPRFVSEWIDAPIERDPRKPERRRIAVEPGAGRQAKTLIEVEEAFRGASLLSTKPKTGRTHQIRVHLLHVGLPIIGDRTYKQAGALSDPLDGAPIPLRPALHARRLAFDHPVSGERLSFESPLPADLALLLDWLRAERAT